MAVKQRARKDEDKAARRRAILAVAARLLDRQQYHRITMAEVARRCNLAKGTLYLYFRSKEELFLAALEEELASWFDALALELATLPPGPDAPERFADAPERFAGAVVRTLMERETFAELLSLVHTVLEQNIDVQSAMAFKRMLLDRVSRGAAVVERAVPGLPRGSGGRVLLRLHALLVGLRQMADPSPVVAEVLARPEMEPLRIEFETELADTLAAMVRGMVQLEDAARAAS
jgi:AcrR family transcriptional regulator